MPLRGIVLRESRDTLVVQATPEEVGRFSRYDPVTVAQAVRRFTLRDEEQRPDLPVVSGDILYNAEGEPICFVQHSSYERERIDVTSYGDSYVRAVAGPLRISLQVEPMSDLIERWQARMARRAGL